MEDKQKTHCDICGKLSYTLRPWPQEDSQRHFCLACRLRQRKREEEEDKAEV